MLWRARTTLPDRPGALAALAQRCGEAEVNILGLQVFPGSGEVTDELVLSTPDEWDDAAVTELLHQAGGRSVVVRAATEAALSDQPTRYVEAARGVLERPMSFPDVVARLFDAEPEPLAGERHDTMAMTVGDVDVQVHRAAPFTAVEIARGAAMAELVNGVLQRSRDQAAIGSNQTGRRMGAGATPEYVVVGDTVTAYVEGAAVGAAQVREVVPDPDEEVRTIDLKVDPGWQRRGIGTRLLVDAAKLAHMFGATEVLLTARSDNQAVLPMVLAAGLRGRIRMAGDQLSVRIPVRDLKPLAETR